MHKFLSRIREGCLYVKNIAEKQQKLPFRYEIHEFAKRVYAATYGLTPELAEKAFNGEYSCAEDLVNANLFFSNYGVTLNRNNTTSHHIRVSEHALYSLISFGLCEQDWQRMLQINNIELCAVTHCTSWCTEEAVEILDLPEGSKIFIQIPEETAKESW